MKTFKVTYKPNIDSFKTQELIVRALNKNSAFRQAIVKYIIKVEEVK